MRVKQKASGHWHFLYGQFLPDLHRNNRHQPCPSCGGKDRFRLMKDYFLHGRFLCNQCGHGDGFDLISRVHGVSLGQAMQLVNGSLLCNGNKLTSIDVQREKHKIQQKNEKSKWFAKNLIKKISEDFKPLLDVDAVLQYFSTRNDGVLLKAIESMGMPKDIFSVAQIDLFESKKLVGKFPAMVANFRSQEGEVITLHRTYLTKDGKKYSDRPKRMTPCTGETIKGGAIRLYEISSILGLAEGIETSIAANFLFGYPVWSASSSEMFPFFQVPEGVKTLIIFCDNDDAKKQKDGISQSLKRARILKDRLAIESPEIDCRIHSPELEADWLDVLQNLLAGD